MQWAEARQPIADERGAQPQSLAVVERVLKCRTRVHASDDLTGRIGLCDHPRTRLPRGGEDSGVAQERYDDGAVEVPVAPVGRIVQPTRTGLEDW